MSSIYDELKRTFWFYDGVPLLIDKVPKELKENKLINVYTNKPYEFKYKQWQKERDKLLKKLNNPNNPLHIRKRNKLPKYQEIEKISKEWYNKQKNSKTFIYTFPKEVREVTNKLLKIYETTKGGGKYWEPTEKFIETYKKYGYKIDEKRPDKLIRKIRDEARMIGISPEKYIEFVEEYDNIKISDERLKHDFEKGGIFRERTLYPTAREYYNRGLELLCRKNGISYIRAEAKYLIGNKNELIKTINQKMEAERKKYKYNHFNDYIADVTNFRAWDLDFLYNANKAVYKDLFTKKMMPSIPKEQFMRAIQSVRKQNVQISRKIPPKSKIFIAYYLNDPSGTHTNLKGLYGDVDERKAMKYEDLLAFLIKLNAGRDFIRYYLDYILPSHFSTKEIIEFMSEKTLTQHIRKDLKDTSMSGELPIAHINSEDWTVFKAVHGMATTVTIATGELIDQLSFFVVADNDEPDDIVDEED